MTTALPPSETTSASFSDQVTLSETDRSRLYTCIHTGHTSTRVRTRAQVLLKLGEGWSLAKVCHAFDVCRMLHDLYTGHPGSKLAGAEWAKAHLDPAWAGLIDRTWAGRPNPKVSVRQPADPADFQATLEFVRYILSESHAFAKANQLE